MRGSSILLLLWSAACTPAFDVPGDSGGVDDSGDPATGDPGTVVLSLSINEIMASNSVVAVDPDDPEATPDWVELYNGSDVDVSLEGLTITDDLDEPGLHVLDDVEVPAGGFVVLLADGDPDAGPTHLPFKLSASGEAVGLFAPDGAPLDQVTYADLDGDQVAGRLPDGGELGLLPAPTPGESNGEAR